jgi:hypothetical protein
MTSHAQHSTLSASNVHPKVFVVRLWEEPLWAEPNQASSSVWRASIHHPESGQRWHFSQPEQLMQFLARAPNDTLSLERGFRQPP